MRRILLLLAVVGLVAGGGLLSKCKKKKKTHVDIIKLIDGYKSYARPLILFLTPEEFVTVAMTNTKSWSKWEEIIESILDGNGDAEVKIFQDICITHNKILQNICQLTDLKIFITKVYAQGVPDGVLKSAEEISPKVIDYGTQIVIFISPRNFVTPDCYSETFIHQIRMHKCGFWNFERSIFTPKFWIGSRLIYSSTDPLSGTHLYLSKRHELALIFKLYHGEGCFKFITPSRVKYFAINMRCDCMYPQSATIKHVEKSFKELKNLFKNGSVSKEEFSKWKNKFSAVEY
jgi:hypothetical protein